ncbi:MAG: hypothetical protein ABSG32_07455 [Terriglobia bacterium]
MQKNEPESVDEVHHDYEERKQPKASQKAHTEMRFPDGPRRGKIELGREAPFLLSLVQLSFAFALPGFDLIGLEKPYATAPYGTHHKPDD